MALLTGRWRCQLVYLLVALFYGLQVAAYVTAEILTVVCDGLGGGKRPGECLVDIFSV